MGYQRVVSSLFFVSLLLSTGCAPAIKTAGSNTPIPNFLNPASPIVAQQARLFWIVMIPAAIVFVIVEGLLLSNVFHHAKQPEEDELPPQNYRQ